MAWDASSIRRQFPILERTRDTPEGARPVTFLDHGASTHAPRVVLDAVEDLHTRHYANVHRGNHMLSRESSDLFDDAMRSLAGAVGADPETQPAVLMGNTTQALDLAAHVMAGVRGRTVTTLMEHHSNDLPHRRRGDVVHLPVDEYGRTQLDTLSTELERGGVKLVAVTGCSNVTGYLPPIHDIARMAHDAGARILVDGAQLLAHAPIDVRPADHPEHIDLFAAAGHKAYAPFGASVLVAPRDLLDAAPPYMPGGGTVTWVTQSDAGYLTGPERHQGGTPNITGAIAFAAAMKWLQQIGMEEIRAHEERLAAEGLRRFAAMEEEHSVHVLGPTDPREKAAVFSFVVPGAGHADVSSMLDSRWGIATRNGCFCAQPMMTRLLRIQDRAWIEALEARGQVELPGATRATFGIYNDEADLELLCDAVAAVAATHKVRA